jgi:hypothetical protein
VASGEPGTVAAASGRVGAAAAGATGGCRMKTKLGATKCLSGQSKNAKMKQVVFESAYIRQLTNKCRWVIPR